jgi:hypothetical protein
VQACVLAAKLLARGGAKTKVPDIHTDCLVGPSPSPDVGEISFATWHTRCTITLSRVTATSKSPQRQIRVGAGESWSGSESYRAPSVGMRHTERRQTRSSGGNVNITTDEGLPVLAIEQGAATEAERSEWVRQLQIPMIYQVGNKKEFMLVHRTSAGAVAIQPLRGAADLADAAVKARSFLAKHPTDAMLTNYDQDWKTYNDRESSNLMNIVAVIYGAALTIAISRRPSLILHPVSAPNLIPSLALLAAGLLTAVSFYGYVLSVGGDQPYDVTWTIGSNKTRGTIRFFADLVLATLYVHLLLAATHVETGPNRAPKLTGFVLAFVLVFAVATVVWGLRGILRWMAIGATGVALALWWWAYTSTRRVPSISS